MTPFLIASADMPTMILVDLVRLSHLAAMAVGFGTMIATDLNMLRRATDVITAEQLRTLHMTHHLMLAAIALAWISGLILVVIRTGLDPAAFSPKLIMKLLVVTVLSITALLVQRLAMPAMHRLCGKSLLEAEFDDKIRMALCGGLSVASWSTALLLGASAFTKTAGWSLLVPLILTIYAVSLMFMLRHALVLHNRTTADRICIGRIPAE